MYVCYLFLQRPVDGDVWPVVDGDGDRVVPGTAGHGAVVDAGVVPVHTDQLELGAGLDNVGLWNI